MYLLIGGADHDHEHGEQHSDNQRGKTGQDVLSDGRGQETLFPSL